MPQRRFNRGNSNTGRNRNQRNKNASHGSRGAGKRGASNHSRGSQNRRPQPRRQGKSEYIEPSRYVNQAVLSDQATAQNQASQHTFMDFVLQPQLQESIAKRGYLTPTPIQDQAIPHILQGKDVAGFAQTGTGKTAAFLIPLLNKVLQDPQQGVLIVTPTRELASQISDEFMQLARHLPISKVLCVGGLSIRPQIEALRQDPHFVIGTPGRLKDLVNQRKLKLELFTNVVLDEVDRMLDIGFVHDIRFLIERMPQKRQALFFSATMNNDTMAVMHQFAAQPEIIVIPARDTSSMVEQDVVRIEPGVSKVNVLTDLLEQPDFAKVIVFGRTKHGVNKLEKVLSKRGLQVCAIHGNKSQNARQRSLRDFEQGRTQVLLATDVASRGIDIDGVTHVINYDEPNTYDDYIHRIGRTGRAGNLGKALTFVCE